MTAPAASAAAGLRQRAGLPVLTWPAFDPLPVEAMVTTRHGGVSAGSYATLNLSLAVGDEAANVRENRRRAAAALGAGPADFVFAAQIHGRRAEVVSAADRGRAPGQPSTDLSGLAVGTVSGRRPDPGGESAGDDPGLRGRGGPGSRHGGAGVACGATDH